MNKLVYVEYYGYLKNYDLWCGWNFLVSSSLVVVSKSLTKWKETQFDLGKWTKHKSYTKAIQSLFRIKKELVWNDRAVYYEDVVWYIYAIHRTLNLTLNF